jgi:Flp pilus assembly protein TadG
MGRRLSNCGPDDGGYAVIWALGVTLAMIGLVGLVVDGGNLLRAGSDAHSVASAAARVGAQELDLTIMLAPGYNGDPVIDQAAATAAVEQYVSTQPEEVAVYDVRFPNDDQILVEVELRSDFQILWRGGQSGVVRMPATARAAEP